MRQKTKRGGVEPRDRDRCIIFSSNSNIWRNCYCDLQHDSFFPLVQHIIELVLFQPTEPVACTCITWTIRTSYPLCLVDCGLCCAQAQLTNPQCEYYVCDVTSYSLLIYTTVFIVFHCQFNCKQNGGSLWIDFTLIIFLRRVWRCQMAAINILLWFIDCARLQLQSENDPFAAMNVF